MSVIAGGDGRPPYRASRPRVAQLLALAWPAVLSYILNNAYRINDQFWIQGLGGKAQTAIGATFFVQVLNFAAMFLAVGGTLALVSRHTGARDPKKRDSVARHALLFGLFIGGGLMLLVLPNVSGIIALLGLEGDAARLATEYLGTLYLFAVPLAVFPVIDAIFIGRGNTRVPMTLQLCAVALNYFLNPLLIYGKQAGTVDAPGAALVARVATALDIEGWGIAGAAFATGLARALVLLAGLAILRYGFGMPLVRAAAPLWRRLADIGRISLPVAVSIAIFALAYWALIAFVLTGLGDEATAALGVGFQVFEGLSFPCYLGLSIAAASLVGREIGAGNAAGAGEVVGSARLVARFLGIFFGLAFLVGGPFLVPLFTEDETVAAETLGYVTVLAFSQYWVAVEAINERVLLGSGYTRPILWISPLGNLLRPPLGWLLALPLGFGAVGVWWAINLTTYLKAFLFWRKVREGTWLTHALADAERERARTDEAPVT